MKKYILWVLVVVVLFLAYATLKNNLITGYTASDWGIVSRLPVIFWTGLGLIITLIFLGRKSTLFLGISAGLLLLYLYAIPTLVNENGIEFASASYFLYGEGLSVAEEGRLVTDVTTHMARYHDWPAFLYLSGILSQVTGSSTFALPHYLPIFNAAFLGLFSFTILRIGLETKLAIIGAMWVLASNFQPHLAFLPQGMGIILTLPLFFLLARQYYSGSVSPLFYILIILLFGALTITHALSALSMAIAAISIYFLNRVFKGEGNIGFIIPGILVLIFLAYSIYVIFPGFKLGVWAIYGTITGEGGQTPVQPLFRFGVATSHYYDWTLALNYVILALNVLIGGLAILYALVGGKSTRAYHAFWVGWLVGLLAVGSIAYGGEGYLRAFSLGLIPVAFLCVSLLSRRQTVLLIILSIIIILNIPAHYGNLTGTQRTVTSADLAARNVYAKYTPVEATYFYQITTHAWAVDPVRAKSPAIALLFPPTSPVPEPIIGGAGVGPPEEVVLEAADYIIDSDEQREEFKYFIGYDFLERLNLYFWGDRWYDNGHARIYKRITHE